MIRAAIKAWLAANGRAANLRLAGWLGAPPGFTCSAYSYRLEKQGKPWGKYWRPRIDAWFLRHRGQRDHCRAAYLYDKQLQETTHA